MWCLPPSAFSLTMKQTYLSPAIQVYPMANHNEPLLATNSKSEGKYGIDLDGQPIVPVGPQHQNPDDIDAKPNHILDGND